MELDRLRWCSVDDWIMKKPALWMGRSGVWVSMGLRWVFGMLMKLYAIFLQNLPYSVGFCDVVCLVFLHLQWRGVAGAVCEEEG